MSEKRLPCPECKKGTYVLHFFGASDDRSLYRVWCPRECWRGPVRDTEAAAIAEWNRVVRHAQKDVAASGGDDGR